MPQSVTAQRNAHFADKALATLADPRLIAGRKAFQKPFKEGVELLHSIQDVYLSKDVTVA